MPGRQHHRLSEGRGPAHRAAERYAAPASPGLAGGLLRAEPLSGETGNGGSRWGLASVPPAQLLAGGRPPAPALPSAPAPVLVQRRLREGRVPAASAGPALAEDKGPVLRGSFLGDRWVSRLLSLVSWVSLALQSRRSSPASRVT